jgi:hypothetical protein
MTTFHRISVALCACGIIIAGAVSPAAAAEQAPVVKAPVAAAPAVVCSNWNWTHGWLDHGGWGGWGYWDGLIVNDWAGSCDAVLGLGPYAYAPREPRQDRNRH